MKNPLIRTLDVIFNLDLCLLDVHYADIYFEEAASKNRPRHNSSVQKLHLELSMDHILNLLCSPSTDNPSSTVVFGLCFAKVPLLQPTPGLPSQTQHLEPHLELQQRPAKATGMT